MSDDLLAELYGRYGSRLYRYALLILADRASAEDAVQDAFCQLARAAGRRPETLTEAYATRIVRNACYTALRKRRRLVAADEPLLEQTAGDASEEERMMLSDALRALPPEQREVVFLKVFEGRTFQEIADLCAISINTVASRHRYALAALRRALGPAPEDT